MILTDDMQTCFHSFALYYMQKKRRFMTGFLYPDINQRCKYVRITQNREQLKTVPDTAGDRNRTGTKFNPRRILSPVRLPIPPRRRFVVHIVISSYIFINTNYSIYMHTICNGRRRIRTFEGIASRFTVCPLWPLGNPSILK